MSRILRALVIEDSLDDAALLVRHLERAGFEVDYERVETREELEAALARRRWDVVLSDFAMPGYSGLDAFELVRTRLSDIPFIFVSGHIGEERAADAMKRGANDYVLKGNMTRLVPAIERELAEAESRAQQRRLAESLKESERRYRALVEGSLQGIAIVIGETIAFANDALAGMFRLGSAEPVKRLAVLRERILEEDRPQFEALLSPRPGRGPAVEAVELRALRGDGSRAVVQVMGWPIEWTDAPATQLVVADVTELKRREEELREKQRLLDTVFRAIPQYLTVKDTDLRYVLVNPRVEQVSGMRAEDLIGATRGTQGFGTPEQLRTIEELDRQAIEAGEVHIERAFPIHMRDGLTYIFDVIRAPIRDEAGAVRGLLTISQDITEQKRAEEALRASQRLLTTVFDSLPVWVTVKDLEMRYVLTNPLVKQILGTSPDQIIGKRFADLGIASVEEATAIERLDEAVLRDGRTIEEFDGRRTVATGEQRRFYIRRAPLRDGDGRIQGLVVVSADVTERANAEEALARQGRLLSTVFDSLPIWLTVKDREGRYVAANQAFLRDLRQDAAAVIGKRLDELDFAEPGNAQELRQLELQVMESGLPKSHPGLTLHLRDGRTLTLATVRAPLFDPSGRVEGIVIVSQDVTERMALEEQFRQSQKMESIGRLAGGVAHDFNNMLAVIMSFSDLVLEAIAAGDPIRQDLAEIQSAAKRAAALTSQLLAFSRRQVLELKPVDVNSVIQSMERLLGRLLGENIQLQSDLQPGLPTVIADVGQIEQAIMNLAVNARDAMPQGGKLIMETCVTALDQDYVSGHIDVKPGDYVQLSMTDTGIGMDETVRAQIFEPFFTTKDKGKGTGLGLSTVYGIVKQSGGSIWVYSEPGKGTTFKLFLPVAQLPARPEGKANGLAGGTIKGESILLVEDEDLVRGAATRILDAAGYKVLSAASGEDALVLLDSLRDPLHLLLTDVVMTGMDGTELAQRALERWPGLRIMFMSGYTDKTISQQGLIETRHGYLQKPFTRIALLAKVRETLDDPGGGTA